MAFLDFLTEGSAPPTVPVSSTQTSVLPDWYTNYAMQLLSNQQGIMNRPYPTYQGPRVAGFTPTQQQGFAQTGQAATAYQPMLQTATQGVQQAANAPGGLQMAQPYISQASQGLPSMTQQFMNPYTEQVVDRIGDIGARTLREKLMPAIGDQAISAGQFGGSRQSEAIGRALRDVSEGVTAQQAQALQQGYTQAQGAAAGELGRVAGLGQMVAGLGTGDTAQRAALMQQLAGLGGQAQALGLTGAGALGQVGQQQQQLNQSNLDVAYADFLRQQGYPQAQIDAALKTFGGVAQGVPVGTSTTGMQQANAVSPSLLSTIGNLGLTAAGLGLFGPLK
jgi:hypothetical protein